MKNRRTTIYLKISAVCLACASVIPQQARAGTVNGTLTATPAGTIDLTAEGTSDWAFYGTISGVSGGPFEHKNGVPPPGLLSNTFTIGGGTTSLGANAAQAQFTDGTPDSFGGGTTYAFNSGLSLGVGLQFTFTLNATSELVRIYLADRNIGFAGDDLSATLSSGGSFSMTNVVLLPASGGTLIGLLTLTVTGAPGDVLTFSTSAHTSGGAPGIQAVTAAIVPEPASAVLILFGATICMRRRTLRTT